MNHRFVRKPYRELAGDEFDAASGCSVCEQDQVEIRLPALAPFSVCRKLAPRFEATLRDLIRAGEPIESVTGYRVGRTRNPIDAAGNRTGLSNHSYGIALDINRARNGLYTDCPTFGPSCRLLEGGEWNPGSPGALVRDGPIVRALLAIGLRWGGELAGNQKDFMHFSPSGD